jgi:hypothetical protein
VVCASFDACIFVQEQVVAAVAVVVGIAGVAVVGIAVVVVVGIAAVDFDFFFD